MKKFFTFILLCGLIGLIVFVSYKVTNKGINIVAEADSQTASTSLLLAQAKQKTISEQAILNDNTDNYVGEKFADCTIPEVEAFKELNIISDEDEHYEAYYVWNQEVLDSLSVNVQLAEGEFYIVNYETNEVITTKGVTINDVVYFKLSEIKEKVV